ncbi:MAG: cupin domain-containing protein [Actinomycetaceae bacterium]|nr:cupin domain-containing protein [Actinomycetaceae bacterium]
MSHTTTVETSTANVDLIQALPIVQDATTSRVIVNNPLLRTVLFSFDKGQLLTEHASPRAVVVTLLTGKLDFSIGADHHIMSPGDVIYLAPGDRHALVALEASHMQLVMVDVGNGEEIH